MTGGHPAYGIRRRVTDGAAVLLAANPSPMTLDGTNTWLLGDRGSVVVDPGPDDETHVRSVAEAAPGLRLVLITHHHPDHTGGARLLHELTPPALPAADPAPCVGAARPPAPCPARAARRGAQRRRPGRRRRGAAGRRPKAMRTT